MRKRKCFLSLVPALETLCTPNPTCCQAKAFCRITLLSLLLPLEIWNIKNKPPKLKNALAVNLVPGTLVFNLLNSLVFTILNFHAKGVRWLFQTWLLRC